MGYDSAVAARAGAVLTAPLAGTIASIPFTAGATETTGTSLVLIGAGAVEVTVNVPATSIRSIVTGQKATAIADGGTIPATGSVESIGLLPSSSASSSTTTYPVVVLVPSPDKAFVDGGAASVSIAVASVTGVVRVPNSALTGATVMVLSKGKLVRTRVVVGTIGPLFSQITSGLQAGEQLVIADLSAALPTSSTATTRRFGTTGGFGGGLGAGGGGAGGGRPPG